MFLGITLWISNPDGEPVWRVDSPPLLYYWCFTEKAPAGQTPQLPDTHYCR